MPSQLTPSDKLTPQAKALATAIHQAAFEDGSLAYEGYDLGEAVASARRVVEETFIPPMRADLEDRPAFSRDETEWIASIEACRFFLTQEELYA